jgi:hypothetical protein
MRPKTDEVPGRWPVAINGRGFKVVESEYQRLTVEAIRQQADTSEDPGEQSLNPQDLWRRSQSDWRRGKGQEWLDREDSDRSRFADSRSVNVWARGEITLLRPYDFVSGSAGASKLLSARGRVWGFLSDRIQSSVPPLTASGSPTDIQDSGLLPSGQGDIRSIATDGNLIYIAAESSDGADGGIYTLPTASPTTALTELNVLPASLVGWHLGKLMLAKRVGGALYNITNFASTAAPTAIETGVQTGWIWRAFGSSPRHILAAGDAGGSVGIPGESSAIYRIGINDDGTLQAPAIARTMPVGEACIALGEYRGLVLIGTTKGVRVAVPGPDGSLTEGRLIPVGPVRDFAPIGDHVYFTQDTASGNRGVGRLNLNELTGELTPAYNHDGRIGAFASDVMRSVVVATSLPGNWPLAAESVQVVGATSFGAFWQDRASYETSGWLDVGKWNHNLDEAKVFRTVEAKMDPLEAGESVRLVLKVDGVEVFDRTEDTPGARMAGPWIVDGGRGEVAELRIYLGGDGTSSPRVTRWLVRSFPVPRRSEQVLLPLDLSRTVADLRGQKVDLSPQDLFYELKALEASGDPVFVQEWGRTYEAFIDRVGMTNIKADDRACAERWWQGTCIVQMRLFSPGLPDGCLS